MKKIITYMLFFLLFFPIIAFIFLPIPIPPIPKKGWVYNGAHNKISGIMWCRPNKPKACFHEFAHKLDRLSNYPSSLDSFSIIVEDMGLDRWENERENYARIFSEAKGCEENIPDRLRPFYDWGLAEEIMENYKAGGNFTFTIFNFSFLIF